MSPTLKLVSVRRITAATEDSQLMGYGTDDHSAEIRAFHSRQFWPLAPRRTVLSVSVI